MSKIKTVVAAAKKKAVQVWEHEPAIVLSAGASALIGTAAAFGQTISHDTAGLVVELVVPLLLGGAIRFRVSPA